MFKSKRVLRILAIVFTVVILINSSLSVWIWLSGAFDAAASAYKHQNVGAEVDIDLCFLCRKKVSYGEGEITYQFSIDVSNEEARRKELIRCNVSKKSGGFEVKFE